MDMPALLVTPVFAITLEMLEVDGVHLVPSNRDWFFSHLCQHVSSSLASSFDIFLVKEINTIVSSDSNDNMASNVKNSDKHLGAILKIVKSNSKVISSVKPLKDSLVKLAAFMCSLESQVCPKTGWQLLSARFKEEADTKLNWSCANCVVVSGLEQVSDGLSTHQAKKDHYTKFLTNLIKTHHCWWCSEYPSRSSCRNN